MANYKWKDFTGLIALIFIPMLAVGEDVAPKNSQEQENYNLWLKAKFAEQHQELIPVVAVADMYYACNQMRKTHKNHYSIKELVTNTDREILAGNLQQCLEQDSVQSDVAVNFGLLGCFQEQLAHLPIEEQKQKMKLVKQAINGLSHEQRKKSLTQCVNDQAINYLE